MAEQGNIVDPNSIVAGSGRAVAINNPKEDAEVKKVLDLLNQGKAYRSEFDNDWETRKNFYNGKQWKSDTSKSKPIMNVIRQMIQATIPILTDSKPGFNPMAKEPSDFDFAQIMGELVESWWEKSSMDHTLIEPIFDAMLYDAGVLKPTWNPELEDGIGDVQVECVDPRDIYVPKGARDFNKNCGWVIQKSIKTVGELRRLFPKKKDLIKPDQKWDEAEKTVSSEDIKLFSPTDQYSPDSNTINEETDTRKTAEIAECWIDDETMIEIEIEQEDGEKTKELRKKYPKGKLITILSNQNILLQSVENPYSHGMKPYIRFVDMILPREFWGEGEAKPLLHTQKLINHVLKHIFDTFTLMTNPLWILKKNSGVNKEQITNLISQVLEVNPDSVDPVKRDFPPSLQTGALEIYHTLITQTESISGIAEISQGRKPVGVTAASAIENLQEAAQTRIRLKERMLQTSLQQLGKMVIALMLQFYRETRVVRITNKSNVWPDYKEFFIEEDENGNYIMNTKRSYYDEVKRGYTVDMTGPNVSPEGYRQTAPSKGVMDISVMAGTAMPWAKSTRANIAFRLFDSGVIDPKELLDVLEWPNAEAVLQRMEEKQAAAPPEPPPQ